MQPKFEGLYAIINTLKGLYFKSESENFISAQFLEKAYEYYKINGTLLAFDMPLGELGNYFSFHLENFKNELYQVLFTNTKEGQKIYFAELSKYCLYVESFKEVSPEPYLSTNNKDIKGFLESMNEKLSTMVKDEKFMEHYNNLLLKFKNTFLQIAYSNLNQFKDTEQRERFNEGVISLKDRITLFGVIFGVLLGVPAAIYYILEIIKDIHLFGFFCDCK